MSPAFPARRRAEQFATLVEGTSTGGDSARSDSPDLAELAELVSAVRSLPRPQPDPSFVADLRTRLMTEAATALAPAATPSRSATASAPTSVQARLTVPTSRTRRERRLAVLVGSVGPRRRDHLDGVRRAVGPPGRRPVSGEARH